MAGGTLNIRRRPTRAASSTTASCRRSTAASCCCRPTSWPTPAARSWPARAARCCRSGVTLNGAINTVGTGVLTASSNGNNVLNAVTLTGTLDATSIEQFARADRQRHHDQRRRQHRQRRHRVARWNGHDRRLADDLGQRVVQSERLERVAVRRRHRHDHAWFRRRHPRPGQRRRSLVLGRQQHAGQQRPHLRRRRRRHADDQCRPPTRAA